jgi:hypothetical protein
MLRSPFTCFMLSQLHTCQSALAWVGQLQALLPLSKTIFH